MRTSTFLAVFGAAAILCGCGKEAKQPDFADLQPVKGVVKRGGQPVKGGRLQYTPDPDKNEFMLVCEVQQDGSYSLATVRLTDSRGERKPGAPMGSYKVIFTPDLADQTAGSMESIPLMKPVTVVAGANDILIDLPAAKK